LLTQAIPSRLHAEQIANAVSEVVEVVEMVEVVLSHLFLPIVVLSHSSLPKVVLSHSSQQFWHRYHQLEAALVLSLSSFKYNLAY
jgi:hypothetical protein